MATIDVKKLLMRCPLRLPCLRVCYVNRVGGKFVKIAAWRGNFFVVPVQIGTTISVEKLILQRPEAILRETSTRVLLSSANLQPQSHLMSLCSLLFQAAQTVFEAPELCVNLVFVMEINK